MRVKTMTDMKPLLAKGAVWRLLMAAFLVIAPASTPGRSGQPIKAAVFDFELVDTSLEGEIRGVNPAETARLEMISELLRALLSRSGKYAVIPIAPAASEIEAAGYIRTCNGCEADIARQLGASVAITGHVQKVSNLILNINIYVRDSQSGELVKAMSADIRGNTDASWRHGLRWLVRHRLLAD